MQTREYTNEEVMIVSPQEPGNDSQTFGLTR